MIQDLHSHSYYSFCGEDNPEDMVLAAIKGGIEVFGITDHHYGVAVRRPGPEYDDSDGDLIMDFQRLLDKYLDHLTLLRDKYADKITLKRGVEIATVGENYAHIPEEIDFSKFDYCMVEHLSFDNTCVNDLFSFKSRLGCPNMGIAHTDMKAYITKRGLNIKEFFEKMAAEGIFWEMNITYDSIHGYKEHQYVKDFFNDKELQDIVRESGVKLSIGFDGHRLYDYLPERIADFCEKVKELGIKLMYE